MFAEPPEHAPSTHHATPDYAGLVARARVGRGDST